MCLPLLTWCALSLTVHRAGPTICPLAALRPKPPPLTTQFVPVIDAKVEVASLVDATLGTAWFAGIVQEVNGNFVYVT
jgi:hypothetical protein